MKSVYLHEVSSAFTGFSAYVFGAFLLLFGGIYTLAYNLDLHVAEFQYVLQNMSFLFIFIIPVVTMRVWAEERRQKTEQLLYALPLTMTQVVMGKYLALLTQLAVPVGLLGLYPLALSAYGNVPLGAAYSALCGFFFLGAALLAIGLLISCLTESQAAAAGLCFVVMLLNYFLVSLAELVPGTAAASLAAFGAVSLAMGGILYGMTKTACSPPWSLCCCWRPTWVSTPGSPACTRGCLPLSSGRCPCFPGLRSLSPVCSTGRPLCMM